MKKKFLTSIFVATILFCGINLSSAVVNAEKNDAVKTVETKSIKRSSDKYELTVTKSYFLTADDAITEKKVTYSFPCGAINVRVHR